ncbi:unnamed protein product, partial [Mesorhabditis spiculigera]
MKLALQCATGARSYGRWFSPEIRAAVVRQKSFRDGTPSNQPQKKALEMAKTKTSVENTKLQPMPQPTMPNPLCPAPVC